MFSYFMALFVAVIFLGVAYQVVIAPRRWMKQYGDGVYSPLRKAYKKAGQ